MTLSASLPAPPEDPHCPFWLCVSGFSWYCEGPALISEHLLGTSSVLSMAVPIVYGEHSAAHTSRGDEVCRQRPPRESRRCRKHSVGLRGLLTPWGWGTSWKKQGFSSDQIRRHQAV